MSQSPVTPAAPDIAHHRNGLVFCLMLAVSLHTIDATIVNVALPHMQGSLQATFDQISWVVTSYIIAAVVLTPLVGWAASRFGVKRLIMLSMILFTLSSVLCGLSLTLEAMLASRLLQGAAGAPLIPLAVATLNRLSSNSKERARMMALFGLGTMVGPVLGPSLGGYITDVASWRWVFFINLPVGILAIIGIAATMKPGMRTPGHKLNGIGFFSLAFVVGALQLALDRGETEGWLESYEIVAYFLICGIALWIYVVNSWFSRQAFIPGALFRDRNFVVGMILVLITAGNMTASVVLQPPMMQNLMGYPVLDTGILLMWRGVGIMAGMMLTPRLTQIVNPRILLISGGVAIACGLYPFVHLTTETPAYLLAVPPIFHGFGLGVLFVLASTIAYATIPNHLQVEASSVFSLTRGLGQAASISVVVALVSRYSQINHSELVERLTPLRAFAPQGVISANSSTPQQLEISNQLVSQQAAMIAYNNAYMALLIAASSVMLAALLVKPKQLSGESEGEHPVEA